MVEISFIGRHPFTISVKMSGAAVIRSKSQQSSGNLLRIVFTRGNSDTIDHSIKQKYDNNFSPRGDPVSDNELGVDSSVGISPLELEGDINGSPNFPDESVSPPPDNVPHISPERATPPNTYPVVDNTQYGAATLRKR